jgi:hypothetical protein
MLINCWWKSKVVQLLWKTVWRFLKKLNIEFPHDPVPLLGIYQKESKSGYNRDTCTLMFIAALFTLTKLWKQSRGPTTGKWINRLWFIYKIEFYLAIEI